VQLCTVSVIVQARAELDESSVDDFEKCEERIVSQWRELTADSSSQLREKVNEVLRPLGYKATLVVLERTDSIALFFVSMTLSAVTNLRHQWRFRQLRDIVQSLFTILSGATRPVRVKKLTWLPTDYERCLEFFRSAQGKQTISL